MHRVGFNRKDYVSLDKILTLEMLLPCYIFHSKKEKEKEMLLPCNSFSLEGHTILVCYVT